jgi:HEAT repeat protein
LAQAGGSATINGILYQVLACLDWAAKLSITATAVQDDLAQARLIIEPAGGGGDIRVHTGQKRIVEQWKAKSNSGTWSLNQIIEEVIPDLYLAADNSIQESTEYRFSTEGRRGTWKEAYDFFRSLRSRTYQNDPLDALDANANIKFFPSRACTELELFQLISQEVRKRHAVATEPELVTRKNLWHVLANFEISESVRLEELKSRINGFLLGVVEYREDVDSKRLELCGTILNLASEGEAEITPDNLLKSVGLSKESFRNWPGFKNRLTNVLNVEFRRKKYYIDKDIRDAPEWPHKMPILILSGSSGQGKTWQLAKTAHECDSKGHAVVFISAQGQAKDDLCEIAEIVWTKGLNKEAPHTVDQVVARLREVNPHVQRVWLIACVDDVKTVTEAKSLAEYNCEESGIRLAITTPLAVGRAIKSQYPDRVQLSEVKDFSARELRIFLQMHDREWGAIPADVRKTLQRPLLANLYCDVVKDQNWIPTNEYELYERYWKRIQTDKDQVDYPYDSVKMLRLADTLLEPAAIYPWPLAVVDQVEIDNETRRRLENVGWLNCDEFGKATIWHDRLLNWAIAQALIERLQLNRITIEELGAKLVDYYLPKPGHFGKTLGYVPMDVLWLACDPARGKLNEVPQLLEALEKPEKGVQVQSLYEDMLPTLGKRVIRPLIARLKKSIAEDYHRILIQSALIEIGEKYRNEVVQTALQLLNEENLALQDVGASILKKYPSEAALDRLWTIHQRNIAELANKDNTHRHWRHDISSDALHSCVRNNPRWVGDKIRNADPLQSPVWALAYLVSDFADIADSDLWSEVKEELFRKVPENKLRSLVTCIRRYRDKDEISRLESWLSKEEDFTAEFAFAALAELAPDIALKKLPFIPASTLAFMRTWWLSQLRLGMPDRVDQKILELMKAAGTDAWKIAGIYAGNEDEMNPSILDYLLDKLTSEIESAYDQIVVSDHPWLYLRLNFLSNISRYDLIQRFEARADTALEDLLVNLVNAWEIPEKGVYRQELSHARIIIKKIGGRGITKMVNDELSNQNGPIRMLGLEWSIMEPDQRTRQLLIERTRSDSIRGNPPYPREQMLAITALAELDEDAAVIESIMKWAPHIPSELEEIRSDKNPMSDASLQQLIPILNNKDPESQLKLAIAIGLSGRRDYLPWLREMFLASEEGSQLARFAMISLKLLEDKDSATIGRMSHELFIKENHNAAANALLRNGSDDALTLLEQYVLRIGSRPLGEDMQLELILWRRKRNRAILASLVSTAKFGFVPHSNECLEEIGKIDDPQINELLWEIIFATEGSLHVVGQAIAAIRGLSRSDPESAFQCAQLLMKQNRRDREQVPALLAEIDETRAILYLISELPQERHTLTRWASCRALRKLQSSNAIYDGVAKLLDSQDYRDRVAGVEICGWQGESYCRDILIQLAQDDVNDKVRAAALHALKRQNRERAIHQLMETFSVSHGSRLWTYLESILEMGDPVILSTRGDRLWIGNILKDASTSLMNFCHRLLERREKELKDIAEKQDKVNNPLS